MALRTSTVRLGPSAEAARRAREHVRALCRRWHAEEVSDPAVLVTSELVTNAVVHGEGEPELTVQLSSEVLMISVGDDSDDGQGASPQPPSTTREGGRGLLLVDATADSWGVVPGERGGKVVWAALRRFTSR